MPAVAELGPPARGHVCRPLCRSRHPQKEPTASAIRTISRPSSLTVADALAFQFRLHVTDQCTGHPALGSDCRRIVKRTVEVELTGDIHIKLTPALQSPFQGSPGRFVFCLLTGRIDGP